MQAEGARSDIPRGRRRPVQTRLDFPNDFDIDDVRDERRLMESGRAVAAGIPD
jgi:hypothetical protein